MTTFLASYKIGSYLVSQTIHQNRKPADAEDIAEIKAGSPFESTMSRKHLFL
jgi:hypothetical protein